MYTLPKSYLSYSALSLWLTNPVAYRKKYYEKKDELTTPEIRFGKHIATLLEENHISLAHVPRYPIAEQPLEFVIDDVPILGYVDSFDPAKKRFLEFKTGHQPWDAVRVRKHLQLTLYSLGIQTLYGTVQDTCSLVWLKTEKTTTRALGLVTHENAHQIKLTGDVAVFKRKISQWERDKMRELIVETARAIHDDYARYRASQE